MWQVIVIKNICAVIAPSLQLSSAFGGGATGLQNTCELLDLDWHQMC